MVHELVEIVRLLASDGCPENSGSASVGDNTHDIFRNDWSDTKLMEIQARFAVQGPGGGGGRGIFCGCE